MKLIFPRNGKKCTTNIVTIEKELEEFEIKKTENGEKVHTLTDDAIENNKNMVELQVSII